VRGYIFSEEEIACLVEWLESGRESALTLMTLSRVRQNLDRLSAHLDLLVLVLRQMEREGRLVGAMRLPSGLASRLRSVESGSGRRRSGKNM
jgi:hypothetical protein